MDSDYVLRQFSVFLAGKEALASLIESRGHICVASPIFQQELAGNGIKYVSNGTFEKNSEVLMMKRTVT